MFKPRERIMANHIVHETLSVPYLEEKGLLSWVFSTDHKRIGIMYLASITAFFILAGSLVFPMRFELTF